MGGRIAHSSWDAYNPILCSSLTQVPLRSVNEVSSQITVEEDVWCSWHARIVWSSSITRKHFSLPGLLACFSPPWIKIQPLVPYHNNLPSTGVLLFSYLVRKKMSNLYCFLLSWPRALSPAFFLPQPAAPLLEIIYPLLPLRLLLPPCFWMPASCLATRSFGVTKRQWGKSKQAHTDTKLSSRHKNPKSSSF